MANQDNKTISFRASDGSPVKLEYHDTLSSTTELAREYAKAGYPDKFVVYTEKQTDSPITRTKLSVSAEEAGIFISVILRPSIFPTQAPLLSHLSAVALATALDEHTTADTKIGWVSDIYFDGVRVGGTSIEGKLTDYSAFEYIIVSFAIKMNEHKFPARMSDMIRKVFEDENLTIGMIIAKTILEKFFTIYAKVKTPEKYMKIYSEKFILTGKKIKYLEGTKKLPCKVLEVDEANGSLVVDIGGGVRKVITSPSGVFIPKKIKVD